MYSRCRWILWLFLFLPLLAAFAGGESENPAEAAAGSRSGSARRGQSVRVAQGFSSPEPASSSVRPAEARPVENLTAPSRAELVIRAIAQAYPDRAGEPEFRDGDWTIEVYGERFYFAEGRLLPASLRDKASEYDPLPFYGNYPKELPPWKMPTPEESVTIKEQADRRNARQLKRPHYFFDTLWRSRNRDEAWEHVKQIRFLGQPVLVHYSILAEVSLVEQQILRAANTNAAVKQWISSINNVEGWSWRNVAATQSRSFHSYGAAIDLLPKSLGGLQTYWLWTSQHTPAWWTVPYSRRFHPPQEVITAFESFGFIWGGKWRYYDTMHFEYRPEILVLSGMPRMDLRDLR